MGRRILTVATLTLLLVALAASPASALETTVEFTARLRLARTWS
jgi:hypothetical protein